MSTLSKPTSTVPSLPLPRRSRSRRTRRLSRRSKRSNSRTNCPTRARATSSVNFESFAPNGTRLRIFPGRARAWVRFRSVRSTRVRRIRWTRPTRNLSRARCDTNFLFFRYSFYLLLRKIHRPSPTRKRSLSVLQTLPSSSSSPFRNNAF